jgi:hypothetical protein
MSFSTKVVLVTAGIAVLLGAAIAVNLALLP